MIVDLRSVETLTSSYFNAGLWPLWSPPQPGNEELFPVLINVNTDYLEDIRIPLAEKRTAVWWTSGTLKSSGEGISTIGPLDTNLELTLRLTLENGAVTAADLLRFDTSIGVTAWSNRLVTLHQQRLLKRQKDGRKLIYSSSWMGCDHE